MTASALPFETQLQRQLSSLRAQTGSLLERLQEPNVVDVIVNPDGRAWCKRIGQPFEDVGRIGEARVKAILAGTATMRQAEFNHGHPILETDFPLDGSRIEGLTEPIVNGAAIAFRPLNRQIFTLDGYTESGIITHKGDPLNAVRHHDLFLDQIRGKNHAKIIRLALKYRRNIVAAGSTGSGKSTLANMLLQEVSQITPQDRVVLIEDTREIRCPVANHVSLLATAEVSLLTCLKAALRLAPDRIVVGEVRDENARELLNAWNTGHPGGIATVHANSAKDTLRRFEQLLNSATPETRETIAQAANVVLFMDKEASNPTGRKLREVLLIHGYDRAKDEYLTESV